MTEIKTEDRAYFAGLFDGEGCVSVHKHTKGSGSVYYILSVIFSATYKPILLELQKKFGGGVYTVDMNKTRNCVSVQKMIIAGTDFPENWKQKYTYHLNSRKALYFLKVIEPFCREKKEQAALGIRFEQGRRHGSNSEHETERCEFFHKELQRMKHEESDKVDDEVGFEDEQQTLCCFEAGQ